jgi:hypothetical protein
VNPTCSAPDPKQEMESATRTLRRKLGEEVTDITRSLVWKESEAMFSARGPRVDDLEGNGVAAT